MSAERVLWDWNVKAFAFPQRVEAASAGGFDVLTVPYRKYREDLQSGLTAGDMLRAASDAGLRLDFLDGMSSWTRVRYPPGADFLKEALDYSADDALRACDELGLRRIVAIAGFPPGALSVDELVSSFGRFTERAAAEGIWVDLEPMPMLGLPTLASAWEIVERVGATDTGVMLDTWHFVRGGPDLELLRQIPSDKLVNLQLVDGPATATGELWEEAMQSRLLPGDGDLPLGDILRALADGHAIKSVGPEAINPALDSMSPAALGRRARRALDDTLAAAGARW